MKKRGEKETKGERKGKRRGRRDHVCDRGEETERRGDGGRRRQETPTNLQPNQNKTNPKSKPSLRRTDH